MNNNLLTLKIVRFSDPVYQVLRAMKKSSPYISVFEILLPVVDPEQSCVFLKLKQKKPPIIFNVPK